MEGLASLIGWTLAVFVGLLEGTLIVFIWVGKIDLGKLISEPGSGDELSKIDFPGMIKRWARAIGPVLTP